jgi:dethiobiotin synthetase
MHGLFVTGTDTDVGKSVLSAALVAAMHRAGEPVSPYKPVLTGLGEEPAGPWPADDELLAGLVGVARERVTPLRFAVPASPHLAAQLAGTTIDPAALIAGAARLADEGGTLVVEGVGGLLVPLREDYAVRDLARELGLPLLIAARPGLGTINHTLLTLEAARTAALDVKAVVLTPWPEEPSRLERSNRETIGLLGEVDVWGLPPLPGPDPEELANAGDALPWREWLGGAPEAEWGA